jgi:HEAT repeat protein
MRFANYVVSVGMVLALASACSKNTNPDTAGYWIDRLDKRQERSDAIKNLGRIGDKSAVPQVLKWFTQDGNWQPEAAYTLGLLKDRSVIPDLIAGLDYNANPRDAAGLNKSRTNVNIVRALAMLQAKEGSEPIKKLLKMGDDRAREACVLALAELGDFSNTAAVVEAALNEGEREPLIRLAAVRALGDLGDPAAVPALIKMLFIEMPNASFYDYARYSLIQIGAPAVPELLRTLKRDNETVESLQVQGSKIAEGAIEAKAASVLGSLRAQSAAEEMADAIDKLYTKAKKEGPSPAYYAVIELAYALGSVGGNQAVKALKPIAKDPDANLRLAACEALTQVGDRDVVRELIAASKVGDPAARRASVLAASRLGTAADLPIFDALAKAGDAKVPAAAMAELVELERVRLLAAKDCDEDTRCWQKKLSDANSRVRERAAYELGWLEAKGLTADLLKAAEDNDAEVRMAAVLSLGRFGGIDPAKLQAIYDRWQNKVEYQGVNQELQRLIARAKSSQKKAK